ncbi:hypothetical protein AOL_s00043g468 [Orbilia oligospora ATCC 24927]|uniref:Mitotic checkpoint regulator, MAD2B-interacting-domain-containing protein n=1 Tax=Arthrobotrys oligospora (strain ATCC 24927 / CBS 115.81 / DSM 1491) TaxID=756982 RepID=G1X444_ARTOA|nr:hypothetical protein AOL_s00043g468 [Orbilia oligospora ATCC 24927]EGX52078.1 hypothetical protein AOL_s00043g468 [Orbilia oligospora ATCC 24927]
MALVSYSDSEGSDTESAPSAPTLPPPKAKSSLSGFLPPPSKKRKLVDDTKPDATSTGPRKIKIELPKITPDIDDVDASSSSSSRARIGKSTGGSGMLSFLPAPKRTGAEAAKVAQESEKKVTAAVTAESDSAPRMLGGGIKKMEYAGTGMDFQPTVEDDPETSNFTPPPPATEEVLTKPPVETKPAGPIQGRAIQPFFKKSATKKKATTKPTGATKVEEKKVSLFSLGSALNERPLAASTALTAAEYKPLLVEESAPAVEDEVPVEASYQEEVYTETSYQPALGAQTFQSISEEVGMDEAEMRMFMGRRGRNAEIKLVDFNVDKEYERNEAARAAGELAPERNVVRSIKPGKHQLTSLLNAAQSQRAALEESFAEGRRNKKEAGSKYGW